MSLHFDTMRRGGTVP